jgi:hypothetical protein
MISFTPGNIKTLKKFEEINQYTQNKRGELMSWFYETLEEL